MARWPKPYREGRVHVMAEKCSTCIFRGGNLMHLQPGRVAEMVEESIAEGGAITCHQTLEYGEYKVEGEAVCRGFYDSYAERVLPLRLAEPMGVLAEVPPPTKKRVR